VPRLGIHAALSAFRTGQILRKNPKPAQRQHLKIRCYGIHEVEGEVHLTLLNITEIELVAAKRGPQR
jgi:hypothetical protein